MVKLNKNTAAYIDPMERDPIMRKKLAHYRRYLQMKDAVEMRLNRPGEVIMTFADGTKKYSEDPLLTLDYLETTAQVLATLSGQTFNSSKSILSCKLPGGHRLQVVAYENTAHSFAMVIRIKKPTIYTLDDFNIPKDHQKAIKQAVTGRQTILVSGGTGTGKTSLTNSLIPLIPEDERLLTIEGVAELNVPHRDWCALTYSENQSSLSGNTPADLLNAALRMSPDRILLGEIQPMNAAVFANAINTGHEGSIATIHANSPSSAIAAIAAKMIISGVDSGSIHILRDQLLTDIKGVVQIEKDPNSETRRGFYRPLADLEMDFKKEVEKALEQEQRP
jgi:type IV secretion system protein VirB11